MKKKNLKKKEIKIIKNVKIFPSTMFKSTKQKQINEFFYDLFKMEKEIDELLKNQTNDDIYVLITNFYTNPSPENESKLDTYIKSILKKQK